MQLAAIPYHSAAHRHVLVSDWLIVLNQQFAELEAGAAASRCDVMLRH